MYKTLKHGLAAFSIKRGLKLGLTAITILTAGGFAGTAFAQTYADDRVGYCAENRYSSDCRTSWADSRKPENRNVSRSVISNCIINPFGTSSYYHKGGCGNVFTEQELIVAKTRYCSKNQTAQERKIQNSDQCSDIVGRATAANWAKQNSDITTNVKSNAGGYVYNQLLKGGAAGLESSGDELFHHFKLRLSNAVFNKKQLGGNATDGVVTAVRRNGEYNTVHAGILSGTDLGAPLTQTFGTASWVGRLISTGLWANTDFVLEVTFGNTGQNKAGSVKAFVGYHNSEVGVGHIYLQGDFNTSGLITGTSKVGKFTNPNQRKTTVDISGEAGFGDYGVLNGLIGREGAVGVFLSKSGTYVGGFVARPAEDVKGAVAHLDKTCEANSLNHLCFLSNQRAVKILTECGDNGTSPSEDHCTGDVNLCVDDPFGPGCSDVLGGHALNIAKVQFCGDNVTNQKSTRCSDIVGRATAANWAKENSSTSTKIKLDAREIPINSHIVRGLTTSLDTNVGEGNTTAIHTTLSLSNGSFNGERLGGDATDGAGYFYRIIRGHGGHHAGIFSGTDLGAPITGDSGTTASWVGRTLVGGLWSNTDFVLEVTFGNNNAGFVEAFIPYVHGYWGDGHIHLDGEFTNTGLITGTAKARQYENGNRLIPTGVNDFGEAGVLNGLIGEEGAVGAFLSKDGWFAGGFVARPAEDVEGAQAFLNETCGDATSNLSDPGDPFHEFCYLRKEERTARIENCTVGSSADTPACTRAVAQNSCITNPFERSCKYNADFRSVYPFATANRIEYCNNTGSALNDPLCEITEVVTAICAYSPFAPVCLDGGHNSAGRTPEKFKTCRADNSNDPRCYGVTPEPSETKVNTAAWVNDFVKIDNPIGLSLVVDINKGSQFLKGGNLRLDQTGITVKELDQLYFSDIPHLKLARSATASPNGVAFFWAESSSTSEILASGILSGTDLGAPASGDSGTTAVWQGVFQSVFIATRTEFELKVTFDGSTESSNTGSIKAFIERKSTDNRYSATPHYYLDGTFDANGLIKGQVTAAKFGEENGEINLGNPLGTSYKGVLRGLIGEGGAVGAFVGGEVPVNAADNGNTFTGVSQFAGGFVAHSFTVNYDAWVDAADPLAVATTSATTNRFLTTTGNVLNKGTVSGSSIAVTMDSAEYRETETAVGVPLGGDVTDGFAYLRGSVNHVGILATTSLGAPLNSKTAEGTWKGSFVSAEGSNAITKESFILNVDFGNERVSATIPTTPTTGYDFKGTFNTRGVIDGTITHTGLNKVSDGIMKGLIGSVGAVGVFISNADADLSYGGGFVARPTR